MEVLRASFNETSESMFPNNPVPHPYYSAGGKNVKFTFTLKKNTDNDHKYMTFTNSNSGISSDKLANWSDGIDILAGNGDVEDDENDLINAASSVAETALSTADNTTINVFISDG